MTRVAFFLLASVLAVTFYAGPAQMTHSPVRAAAPSRSGGHGLPLDLGAHYRYILASQRESGAIAMTPGSAGINPYFANLAGLALVTRPEHLDAVQRYLNWYLVHLNPDGTIDDYRLDGDREVTTGSADSTDSYAATFLSLVAAWVESGGDTGWVRAHRAELERVAGAIVAVTDADGLTWAKPGYAHKLLMDNCEVYQGWSDWSRLLLAMGDQLGAVAARTRAEQVRAGLAAFSHPGGSWGWAIDRSGTLVKSDMTVFYPDAVAQVFPLTFGVSEDPGGYRRLDRAQPAWRRLEAAEFPWLLPAFAAARAGDSGAVRQALEGTGRRHPALRWPWYVAESAWVIRAANSLNPGAPSPFNDF